jgi:inosine-uridine nucleoside N-ribohydrolase
MGALLLVFNQPCQGAPARIIFDTDMASDVDDAGALAVLHALADRGEAEVLATVISSRNEWVGPCLDAINTYYGRPETPIGYGSGPQHGYPTGDTEETPSKYVEAVAKAFPHRLQKSSDAPKATSLYRRVLAAQPDQAVTIVSVGFLTNLKDLLNSDKDQFSELNGEGLVKRKVKLWVCMGGKFPDGQFSDGNGEYNVIYDTGASVRVINDWPTPAVFSGFEIGQRIKTGKRLREAPQADPVRACYQFYNGLNDRESWDHTAVLFAVRDAGDYWTLSDSGYCVMHARVKFGYNEWIPTRRKEHRYLIEKMPPDELGKVIEDLMLAAPRAKAK